MCSSQLLRNWDRERQRIGNARNHLVQVSDAGPLLHLWRICQVKDILGRRQSYGCIQACCVQSGWPVVCLVQVSGVVWSRSFGLVLSRRTHSWAAGCEECAGRPQRNPLSDEAECEDANKGFVWERLGMAKLLRSWWRQIGGFNAHGNLSGCHCWRALHTSISNFLPNTGKVHQKLLVSYILGRGLFDLSMRAAAMVLVFQQWGWCDLTRRELFSRLGKVQAENKHN